MRSKVALLKQRTVKYGLPPPSPRAKLCYRASLEYCSGAAQKRDVSSPFLSPAQSTLRAERQHWREETP